MTTKPIGRPSILNESMAELICTRMAEGESLRSICRDDVMPSLGTVFRWVAKDEQFREQYEAAMGQRAESLFEEILEIADDGANDTYEAEEGKRTNTDVIARSRLRVDARKWVLSKMLPKKYGDRIIQDVSLTDTTTISARLKAARERIKSKTS